jgi:hypothetical protein
MLSLVSRHAPASSGIAHGGQPSGTKHGLWRVAEDDPDPGLYAESSDADTVISYMTACRSTLRIVTGSSRAAAWLL